MSRFDDRQFGAANREEQKRGAEARKKELATKLIARRRVSADSDLAEPVGTGPADSSNKTSSSPDKAANGSYAGASKVLGAVGSANSDASVKPVEIGIRLWDDVSRQMSVVSAIEHLAGHLLHATSTRRNEVVLLWPGSLRSLAMAHAAATVARWHDGDKRGLRTLIYPAKANFLHTLNHLHLDRADLIRLAQELVETRENKKVKVSLPDKDPFWFALNSVNADAAGAIHPTLSELLPHYFADKDFVHWRSCDGDLLRYVKARIADSHHRAALNSGSIRSLSAPATAPDALFAISWRASQESIRLALKELRTHGRPDVVCVDATRAMRKGNPSWKANLVRFAECLREIWPRETPPLVMVIDEPHVRSQVRSDLEKRAKKSAAASWLLDSMPTSKGVVCSSLWEGSRPITNKEPSAFTPKSIRVVVTDTEAAALIQFIERLRNSVTEPRWQKVLDDASSYLARLAALPSSTRMLVNWLEEAAVPMAARAVYAWPVYRSRLEEVLHEPTFGEKDRLKRIIEKGNTLWVAYENGTPLARHLADLIEEHTRGTEKCCVAFTRPTAKRLAERYFETYDGYPEGAGFEVLRDCVRFVVSRELNVEAQLTSAETLVLVGLDEEALRLLILDERISSPTYVLLTRRNAAYLKATLRAIDSMPEFASLKPRVREVLGQLPDFLDIDERTLLARSDFVLPTFSFEHGLSDSITEPEDQDPNAWTLTFEEDGQTIRRGPNSRVYIYDPSLSHTSARGFRGVEVNELREGDRLFVMSFELREAVEVALREAGVPISNDRRFETDLRLYHQRVAELANVLPGGNAAARAHALYSKVCQSLGTKTVHPAETTVKSWMEVDRFKIKTFDEAKPGAPRSEAHFKAFAQQLGLDDFEAVYFWKAVIQPLRGVRRADGRRVTDAYTDLLLEPEAAVVHQRLRPEVVRMLFARARENVHAIEAINRPKGAHIND